MSGECHHFKTTPECPRDNRSGIRWAYSLTFFANVFSWSGGGSEAPQWAVLRQANSEAGIVRTCEARDMSSVLAEAFSAAENVLKLYNLGRSSDAQKILSHLPTEKQGKIWLCGHNLYQTVHWSKELNDDMKAPNKVVNELISRVIGVVRIFWDGSCPHSSTIQRYLSSGDAPDATPVRVHPPVNGGVKSIASDDWELSPLEKYHVVLRVTNIVGSLGQTCSLAFNFMSYGSW